MDSFDDKLIELIRDYPCLYKVKDKRINSLVVKHNCWKEIASKLKKSIKECKNKWRNIRDNYRKIQNKKKTGTDNFVSKYNDERLSFLNESCEENECLTDLNSVQIIKVETNAETDVEEGDSSTIQMATFQTLQPSQEGGSFVTQAQNKRLTKKKKNYSLAKDFKRNREQRMMSKQMLDRESTPIHAFFKSMADVVCQFPQDKIARIRAQVCNIVTETELLILAQREMQ